MEPLSLTREELYEKVWSEPMSILCKQLGLSDVGLAKMCKRLRVPRPWRGYWARKAAGQKVNRTPLPKLSATADSSLTSVTIRSRLGATREPDMSASGPVPDQQRFEAVAANRIMVAAQLENPHPLVAQTVVALRRGKTDHRGLLQPKNECLDVQVTLSSSDRAMCIFDALIKGLDARGYETSVRKTGGRVITSVRVLEEDVAIQLTERVDRVERKAAAKRTLWSQIEYDWIATGNLTIRIDSWADGTRQTWSDGKQQRLENCLNQFIVGIVIVAGQMHERHLQWAEQERQRNQAEERRLRERQREEEERGRIRAVHHTIDMWHTANTVRRYLSEVRSALGSSSGVSVEIKEWLEWADAYADRIDPLLPFPRVPVDPKPTERQRYEC